MKPFMKKFITSILLCTLLCSCGTPTQDVSERTQQSGSASNSAAAVSESPLVTESPAVTGSPVPTTRTVRRKRRRVTPSPVPTLSPIHPEKIKPGVVIDLKRNSTISISKYGCREEIIDGKGYGCKIKSGEKSKYIHSI